MQSETYYREQAARARRLAGHGRGDIYDMLLRVALDFDDIAEDLKRNAIEIRHPERLPQNKHCPD